MTNGLPQGIDEIAQQALDNVQGELESKSFIICIQLVAVFHLKDLKRYQLFDVEQKKVTSLSYIKSTVLFMSVLLVTLDF